MDISKETVKKVAKTARINLTDEELSKFTLQFKDILEAFSKINEVDTRDVKMSIQPIELKNALRSDVPGKCLTVDEALKNTEHKKDNYFKGPRVIL